MYTDYKYNVEEHMMQGNVANFIYRVYGWMAAALAVSAGVAYYVASEPKIYEAIFRNSWALIGLIFVQIGLVFGLSFFINSISYGVAIILFMLYAASLGLTLSSIFLLYTTASIYLTFFVTAGTFGLMCLYGYTTKSDLTTMRNYMTMALFGLILGFVVNMFLKSEMVDYIFSAIGVVIFTILTAADMQKIKEMGYRLLATDQSIDKVAVLGALTLYLDFVNLFLLLLRFTGTRRDN